MAAVETTGANDAGRWRARLALGFVAERGRSRLRRRGGFGPLYVQKPFYPEGSVCHVYLLHPPGGLVGGDVLGLDLEVEAGANVLVTTPAATKFYGSRGPLAEQHQVFRVAAGASLEWLPQDTVLFSGSHVRGRTEVHLVPGARYLGWELNCLGRPASGDDYPHGTLDQRIALVTDAGAPLVLERNRWCAGDRLSASAWGLAGCRVSGSLYGYPADPEIVSLLRARLAEPPSAAGLRCALTLVNGVLLGRVLGSDAECARRWLVDVWRAARPLLLGRAPCVPRIWST